MRLTWLHPASNDRCGDPIAIRFIVAEARRICPAADLDGLADLAIAKDAPLGIVKAIAFDQIAAAFAARPAGITFRRAPLAAVLAADRRRA